MSTMHPLRIFLIEDHDLVRKSLSLLVSRRPEFQVVGEAGTAAEALARLDQVEADVVIIDVHLPDQSGIAVSREIRARHPKVKVLVLTSHGDDRAIISAVLAGAMGYLLKEVRAQELVDAIRKAARGQRLLDPSFARRVLERVQQGVEDDETGQLTPEEQQILDLVAQGKTDKEIATEVSLTETDVKGYIPTIYGKLEVIRRTQSVAYSITWRSRQGSA